VYYLIKTKSIALSGKSLIENRPASVGMLYHYYFMQTKHAKSPMLRLLQAGILLCLIVMAGCKADEEINNQLSSKNRFFEYSGKLNMTNQILSVLQTKNDTLPFVDDFVDKYGYPMWEEAVDVYEGGNAKLFVPVHKKGEEEIENIWVFQVNPPSLNYGLLKKNEAPCWRASLRRVLTDKISQLVYYLIKTKSIALSGKSPIANRPAA